MDTDFPASHTGEAEAVCAELRTAFDEFLGTFADFREANDDRLGEIEQRLSADVLTSEKVERINAALDEQKSAIDRMVVENRRPQLGSVPERKADPTSVEHKSAFDAYMRKGDAQRLQGFEVKALSGESEPDGGFVIPVETEAMVDRVLSEVSPIRSIASVRQIGAASFRKPISLGGLESGWVGETGARTETTAASLSLLEFPAMELFAMPAATQSLLDDAHVNIEEWLAGEVNTEFAEQEGKAFVSGDGVAKPRGILGYPAVADASHTWGKIGYVATGSTGDFPSTGPTDVLVDLVYASRQSYRANGHWVMNRKTQGLIRKFKDDEGNYLWQPGLAPGQPSALLGYPVSEAEDMPDVAADAFAIAFGDFRRGYLIVDRLGMRVLRDPYSAKPYVLFYTTKRVGGGVQDFNAIKLLKFAAS